MSFRRAVQLATVGLGFGAFVFLVALMILTPLVSESVTFDGHNGQYSTIAYSPDGKLRAVKWDRGRAVQLSDATCGKELAVLWGHTDQVRSLAFSSDGSILASGSTDNTVRLWDVPAGTLRATLTSPSYSTYPVAFSPDGTILATGGSCVQLWDVASGKVRATLAGQSGIICLAFSPGGKFLATGSLGDTLWLRDVASGKRVYLEDPWWLGDTSVDYPTYVAFSADGKTLAASVDERIGLWDVASGKNTVTLDSGLHFAAFAPDGALILFQNNNRTVEVRVLSTARVKVLFTLSVLCGLGAVGLLYRLGTALAGAAARRQPEKDVSPAVAA